MDAKISYLLSLQDDFVYFFPMAGPIVIDLGQLLRPEIVTILLWRQLIGGHRYPLRRDGQFFIQALSGIRTRYLWCSRRLPYPLRQLVGRQNEIALNAYFFYFQIQGVFLKIFGRFNFIFYTLYSRPCHYVPQTAFFFFNQSPPESLPIKQIEHFSYSFPKLLCILVIELAEYAF